MGEETQVITLVRLFIGLLAYLLHPYQKLLILLGFTYLLMYVWSNVMSDVWIVGLIIES